MVPLGGLAWRVKPCSALPDAAAWVGDGLRVNPLETRVRGTIRDDEDSHWYLQYSTASRLNANYFDKIIASMCHL